MIITQYVPYVGDSKRAMDEYTSEIFMGGRNTIVMHNTCEDSLLAAPLILDLVLLAELCTRIEFKTNGEASWEGRLILARVQFGLLAALLPWLTLLSHEMPRQTD